MTTPTTTAPSSARAVAVDWSGARAGAGRRIWLGEAVPGELLRLEGGRDRAALERHLRELADRAAGPLVVGLDFAFSLPAWFLEERGIPDGPALWDVVAAEGERWLAGPVPPFWGRNRTPRPPMPEPLRATEQEVVARWRVRPSSPFQVGGAGSVGTGSLRGMPMLARLRRAGFAVWPWDAADGRPLLLEIYPRLLTGPVVKRDPAARVVVLAPLDAVPPPLAMLAAASEDAFDAACSAVGMARALPRLLALPAASDPRTRREGRIWEPAGPGTAPRRPVAGEDLRRPATGCDDRRPGGPDRSPRLVGAGPSGAAGA